MVWVFDGFSFSLICCIQNQNTPTKEATHYEICGKISGGTMNSMTVVIFTKDDCTYAKVMMIEMGGGIFIHV